MAASSGHDLLGLGRASQASSRWPGQYLQTDVAVSDLSETIRQFNPDAIVHAAGTASVSTSIAAPFDDFRAATLTWANMLEGVRRSGRDPLAIFLSSAAIYGSPAILPVKENAPIAPISPYGFHKAACELLAREYAECFDIRTVVCRLFSVFGPAQRRLLVWELFQQALNEDSTIWLNGTGNESRDYLHVDDVASAFLALVTALNSERNPGCEFLNVASGNETNVVALGSSIRDHVAPQKQVACRGVARMGDPISWRADISRLRALLPMWRPRGFEEGLIECLNSWRNETS